MRGVSRQFEIMPRIEISIVYFIEIENFWTSYSQIRRSVPLMFSIFEVEPYRH